MTSFYPDLFVRNLEHEFDLCVTKTPTSEETSCPICMEDVTDKNKTTTACGHVFHSSCIFKNMMLRTSCPMCREDLICKSIPSSNTNANTNTNTNINININYNLSQNNSQLMESQLIGNQLMGSQLMDIDDDIINAMLSQELLSQELYYDEPSINNNNETETVNASDSDSDDNDSDSEYADSTSDLHRELDNNSSRRLPTLADPDDDDVDYENDDFERFETDLTLSEVTNKMIELGYTQEDMFYYMTWRVNPFYFNMQYINKYNDEFYNTMTETMHKIFSKEIPITSNSEVEDNSTSMTIDELN